MAPNFPRKPILICSKCGRKGFIRKKEAKFRVPQRNRKFTFYQILDYIARISFVRFVYELEHNTKKKEISLDDYRKVVPFSPHSKKELSEFESKVRSRLNRLVTGIDQHTLLKEDSMEDKDLAKGYTELSLLYFSLCFISLRKLMQHFNFHIEEKFEEELISHIRDSFYLLTASSDKRNKLNLDILLNIMKDEDRVGLNYAIAKNLKEFHYLKCRRCKIQFHQDSTIKKCVKCGFQIDKAKSSPRHLRKRLEELETKTSQFPTNIYYFLAFTIVVRDDLLKEKSMKSIFKNYFDETLSDYLVNLNLNGTVYYVMVHSANGKKQQCYLNNEKDLLGIRILDDNYITAFKEAIRILVYGHRGNLNEYGVVVYNTLRLVNFPTEHRQNKAMEDYKNFSSLDHKEETCKKYSELKPLLEEFHDQSRQKKDIHDSWINLYQRITKLQEVWKEEKRIPNYFTKSSYDNNSMSSTSYKKVNDSSKKASKAIEEIKRLLIEGTFDFSNVSH
jgi:hypothetical protein